MMINEETLMKGIRMNHEKLAADPVTDIPGNIEVNQLIYITKSKDDELTRENLGDVSAPKMVDNDLDLPFSVDKSIYNNSDFVKVRVVSNKDWGRVNWKTGELIDETTEPVHVEKVILNIHGGSWMGGCSGSQLLFTKKYTMETDYPVFSVDYRLAPATKFPGGLSDCFQTYLWLTHYAEKYLKLSFNEIVVEGDSAGGNITISMTSLLIQKNLNIPHGLSMHYPAICADRRQFHPSLVISIDDESLNFHYLPMVLNMYIAQDSLYDNNSESKLINYESHRNASVFNLPDDILAKFPPTKFIIAEKDPLRDGMLRFMVRLLRLGVQTDATIYKHVMHGFMGHAEFPEELKIKQAAVNQAIENLKFDY